jgi:2-polyprenyl-3-methyl-5-hydroxy-6-metoxy-1,4-benzoquinol methylase
VRHRRIVSGAGPRRAREPRASRPGRRDASLPRALSAILSPPHAGPGGGGLTDLFSGPEHLELVHVTAIDWHSKISETFDSRYLHSSRFAERFICLRRLILEFTPVDGSFLDAGCGSGRFSVVAATKAQRVVAFDGSAEMVALARKMPLPESSGPITFDVADIADIAHFGLGAFDVVFSSSVLEYVEDLDSALVAHAAMLKPGGTLIVSMPNGSSLYRAAEKVTFALSGRPGYLRYVHHMPRPHDCATRLRALDLQPVSITTYGAAPLVGGAMRRIRLGGHFDTLVAIAARKA